MEIHQYSFLPRTCLRRFAVVFSGFDVSAGLVLNDHLTAEEVGQLWGGN